MPRVKPDVKFTNFGLNNITIGSSTGVLGTGSMAFNDYLLNGGAHLQLGTGENVRACGKIFLKGISVKMTINTAAQTKVRMLFLKSRRTNVLSVLTSNANLTSAVEAYLLTCLNNGGSAEQMVDRGFMPGLDNKGWTIAADQLLYSPVPAGATSSLEIHRYFPLNIVREYNAAGNPLTGEWALYLGSTGGTCAAFGTITMHWCDLI